MGAKHEMESSMRDTTLGRLLNCACIGLCAAGKVTYLQKCGNAEAG